jgi:Leucine-rich repeat (LRR) protein
MVDKSNFTPMNPKKSLQKVIQEEEALGKKLSEETHVDLIYRGIGDLDNSINSFKACVKLSLSSNIITRIPEIQLDKIEILSLGRNKIK